MEEELHYDGSENSRRAGGGGGGGEGEGRKRETVQAF